MQKRIKKRYDIETVIQDALNSKTFELDKNIIKVHGLLLESNRDDLLFYRGSAKIEINRQEIFPEKYACKLLMTGINVSPNDRYYDLGGIEPGNGMVKLDYVDSGSEIAGFANYRVTLYLDCEINDVL